MWHGPCPLHFEDEEFVAQQRIGQRIIGTHVVASGLLAFERGMHDGFTTVEQLIDFKGSHQFMRMGGGEFLVEPFAQIPKIVQADGEYPAERTR